MMTTTFEGALAILSCFDWFDGPDADQLWWRTDGGYAPITFMLNCNDLFVWGCSDCEDIGPVDVPDFKRAVKDTQAACDSTANAPLLWIARKRKCRPQVAYYKHFHEKEKPLFDACGSAEDQYGNGYTISGKKVPKQSTVDAEPDWE